LVSDITKKMSVTLIVKLAKLLPQTCVSLVPLTDQEFHIVTVLKDTIKKIMNVSNVDHVANLVLMVIVVMFVLVTESIQLTDVSVHMVTLIMVNVNVQNVLMLVLNVI